MERTFAWINRNRRLSKEYDLLTTSTENFIYLAMSSIEILVYANFQVEMGANTLYGGKGGIRTLDIFPYVHAFQACALGHSATFP